EQEIPRFFASLRMASAQLRIWSASILTCPAALYRPPALPHRRKFLRAANALERVRVEHEKVRLLAGLEGPERRADAQRFCRVARGARDGLDRRQSCLDHQLQLAMLEVSLEAQRRTRIGPKGYSNALFEHAFQIRLGHRKRGLQL